MHNYIYGVFKRIVEEYYVNDMLSKYELVDETQNSFARGFWLYGDTSYHLNNTGEAGDLFIIEVYERKITQQSDIDDIIQNIRKNILFQHKVIRKDETSIAYIGNISITENVNDPAWKSFTITIPVNILEVNNG